MAMIASSLMGGRVRGGAVAVAVLEGLPVGVTEPPEPRTAERVRGYLLGFGGASA